MGRRWLWILLSAVPLVAIGLVGPARESSSAAATGVSSRQGRTEVPALPVPAFAGQRGGFGRGFAVQELQIVDRFDVDGNGRLDETERATARQWLAGQGRRGRGRAPSWEPPARGAALTPGDVKSYVGRPVYDPATLRTFFLEFDLGDWEPELEAFNNTDVEVPARLTVDGQTFNDIGVHFRGLSSYMDVPAGYKRSLNLSLDFVHGDQDFGGYRTFNLLNAHEDPTFMRTVLYLEAAREYLPAPKANFVRVVINGENWGIYVSAQQFNKDFIADWYPTNNGDRWKVPGRPNARGGLEYLGDDPAPYRRLYEIKSRDDDASWAALVALTRVLQDTPDDQLETALAPVLAVDEVLRFLALEVTLVNNDGYWVRASDYSLFRDPDGRFHAFPHDANETFPVRLGRGGGGTARLEPLVGLSDFTKPLRSRLLAVPALRDRYLADVQGIAARWLDWGTVGPRVEAYRALIRSDVVRDTHKLDSIEAFDAGIDALQQFVESRRTYLDRVLAGTPTQ